MATLSQLPAALAFNGVAGNPANILYSLTLTDANAQTIPWNQVTGYQVDITDQYGQAVPSAVPTVTSPSPYKISVGWTASQTVTLGQTAQPRMALSIFLNSAGPYALVAGPIVMTPPEYPAS